VKTSAIVSEVHHGVANTHTMVSDIHRYVLKSQEGADDQNQSVSVICAVFRYRMNKWSPLSRLKPGQ